MTIGQRIRQLRILRGFASQQAFADALRIAQSHVHKLETGDGLTMQVGTLLKIARKLRVKPGALLDTQDYRAAIHQIASEQAEAEEQNATLDATVPPPMPSVSQTDTPVPAEVLSPAPTGELQAAL